MEHIPLFAGLLLAVTAYQPAFSHAGPEVTKAAQNAGCKAAEKFGQGCEGIATHPVRVGFPLGVIDGKSLTGGARGINRSGGRLGDNEYDGFIFETRMTEHLPAGQDAHSLKSPAPAIRIKDASQKMAQAGGGHHHAASAAMSGDLKLSPAWTRATPPGARVAGGFITIENTGKADDRLIGGSIEVARVLEVHEMAMDNGVMKMRALDKGLAVAAGGKVELKPGGYHFMFIDLKRPIREGETLKGELVFEKAGKVPVEFKAMAIGARGDAGGHGNH